jgi:hypothetical protein
LDCTNKLATRAEGVTIRIVTHIRRTGWALGLRRRGGANNRTTSSTDHAACNGTANTACCETADGCTSSAANQGTSSSTLTGCITCAQRTCGENNSCDSKKLLHFESLQRKPTATLSIPRAEAYVKPKTFRRIDDISV